MFRAKLEDTKGKKASIESIHSPLSKFQNSETYHASANFHGIFI